MKKIKKYLYGNPLYSGILSLDLKILTPDFKPQIPQISTNQFPVPLLSQPNIYKRLDFSKPLSPQVTLGTKVVANKLSELLSNGLFNDGSDFGRAMGTLFSLGVSSAGQTMADNLIKGNNLMYGLKEDLGNSLVGTGVGLAALGIGKGINSLGGDSMLSRGLGQGIATGLGTIGGRLVTNGTKNLFGSAKSIFSAVDSMKKAKDATEAAEFASKASAINPYALGMSVAGSALGAALGPSKEYGGKYGNITKTMDTVYDTISSAANFIPGAGLFVSGAMILNKGLSNLFGSTSGMTKQDAFLGSAFMPAPVKWLNMAGANTTSTFNNLSWQNSEKVNTFMGNAFGNLNDKFDKAREEAGKTYGTFSQGAYKEAQDNINFSNYAWDRVLAMADLNELLNIRSLYMTSINNLRYASNIQGNNRNLVGRGKQGMKIFNNATNHNIGMRLLSAAALIDNKAMILSAQGGTKVTRPPRMRAHRKGDESRGLTPEEQEWWRQHEEEQKRQLEEETARKIKEKEEAANKFNKQTSTVMGAMTLQANETPFTGLEYQQAAEDLRQKKVEKFHEAEKIGEATLMADLAVSAAPLLLRGFRWAFNKAGLLVKVPVGKYKIGKEFSNSDIILPKEYNIENSPKTINYYPDKKILNNVSTIKWNDATKPSVNWNADNWFKTISGRTSYSSEEAAELVSHIPEYREIEKRLFNEGKLIIDSNGNIIVKGSDMSPQEYIMRQSEAFQKMNPEHHYVGVKKELRNSFENESRDPQTENRYEVWTDRKDPKNVEEYAYSGFEGDNVDSRIEKLKKLLDAYQNGYYNSYWKRDLKEAKEMYESGQINKQYYDDWVNKINNSYNEEISRIKRDLEATIRQKEIDPLNGGKVFDVTYPKDINETPIINAEGRNWAEIPYEYVERDAPDLISHYKGKPHPDEVQTDVIINMAKRHGYPVTHINNVMDTGNGTLLNETIIGKNIPVKSVLGNTGSFDIDSPNKWKLYRSWLPWFLGGSTAATLYNTNK